MSEASMTAGETVVKPNFPVEHISPSQVNTFTMCQLTWMFRYIEGLQIPPGFAALRGSGVHKGAEINFEQKKESREDLKVSDIVDASVNGFDERMEKGGFQSDYGSDVSVADQKGKYRDSTAKAAEVFATVVAPKIQPVIVEKRIEAPLNGCGVDNLKLVGIVDNISAVDPTDPEDERRVIRDLKVSGRAWKQEDVDVMIQLPVYELLYRSVYEKPSDGSAIDVIKPLKTKTSVLEFQAIQDDAALKRVGWMIWNMVQVVKAQHFSPVDPGHWKCSPKWCGYYDRCPAVSSRYRATIDMGGK